MSKREKIILVAMAVAVAYGAWEYLVPKSVTRPAAQPSGPGIDSAFVAQMNEAVKQLDLTQSHEHVIQKAATPWQADPFVQEAAVAALPEAVPETGAPRQAKVAYTGFITFGGKTMAIINGIEYERGETIEPGGLVVEQILPTQVVLKPEGQGGNLTVPLEDDE